MKINTTKSTLAAVTFFLALGSSVLYSQINTEAMRKDDIKPGFHFKFGGDIGYIEGNSSVFQNRSVARLDWVQDWGHLFLVANYKVSTKDKKFFINKGFSHVRYVKPLRDQYDGEIFVQQEFNEFISLNSRSLVGSGLRLKWNKILDFGENKSKFSMVSGVGLMYEVEDIDAGDDGTMGDPIHGDMASLLRSTNYLVLGWSPVKSVNLLATTYYQVDTKRLQDYRLLSRAVAEITVTKRLSVTLEFNLRYDSEPPAGVKDLDMDFTQGITYRINS